MPNIFKNSSLSIKYIDVTPPTMAANNTIIKKNHLFLIPPTNSITKAIIKYIITEPVSGSINVNIAGIITIINIFIKNLNSSRVVGEIWFSLKSFINFLWYKFIVNSKQNYWYNR